MAPSGQTATEIATSVERGIQTGTLQPGAPLESVRQMAARLNVSPTTVASAYRTLRERGLITTHERSRTRVSMQPPLVTTSLIPLPDSVRDLASGNPDRALLPDLRPALRAVAPPSRLYGAESTLAELDTLAKETFRAEAIEATEVAVVNGALDGIERVLMAHTRPGDGIAVEDPCYTGVLDLLRAMGLVPRPVAIDDDGPIADALERTLAEDVAAFIVTPRAQNPTGAVVSTDRAAELRAVLDRRPNVLVVENDYAADIVDAPREVLVGGREQWASIRSVTKSYGPDLRLALVTGDPLTIGRVEGRQLLGCGWVSHILQRTFLSLANDDATQAALGDAARLYDRRRETMLTTLAEHGIPARGPAGLNVWVPVQEEETVVRGLLQLGWAIRGGGAYRLASPPGVRITTATMEPGEAEAFATDFARIVAPQRRTRLA